MMWKLWHLISPMREIMIFFINRRNNFCHECKRNELNKNSMTSSFPHVFALENKEINFLRNYSNEFPYSFPLAFVVEFFLWGFVSLEIKQQSVLERFRMRFATGTIVANVNFIEIIYNASQTELINYLRI